MERRVEPELLDVLPANDPFAMRSRRDLVVINAWMGNARIMARALRAAFADRPLRRVAEVGAGDGRYALSVARRLARAPVAGEPAHDEKSKAFVLVDRIGAVRPKTLDRFARLGWRAEPQVTDVMTWLSEPAASGDAIIANLFLHHFSEAELAKLFRRAADRVRVVIGVEPRRNQHCARFCRWLWLLGCNRVTRHDALVSIRAGFTGTELSRLWPVDGSWVVQEGDAGWCSHLFVAQRKD